MKRVIYTKPGYISIKCSNISNIPYNLIFTTKFIDSSILITVISWDYLNLSLANEYVGDVTIPTQDIKHNQNVLQADKFSLNKKPHIILINRNNVMNSDLASAHHFRH